VLLGCVVLVPVPAGTGAGRRVVYDNLGQRLWLVAEDGLVERTYPVSGRYRDPGPGIYYVYAWQRYAEAGHDGITMEYFVAFNPAGVGYGFHTIPVTASGVPLQGESELGQFRSAGCVRQRREDAIYLWNWSRYGDPVVVI
jgi:lipoprotein-anchoring transpeptidase ErfK/SrfK